MLARTRPRRRPQALAARRARRRRCASSRRVDACPHFRPDAGVRGLDSARLLLPSRRRRPGLSQRRQRATSDRARVGPRRTIGFTAGVLTGAPVGRVFSPRCVGVVAAIGCVCVGARHGPADLLAQEDTIRWSRSSDSRQSRSRTGLLRGRNWSPRQHLGLSGVACLRSTGWGGTVPCVAPRPVIDLDVIVDGRSIASETTATWAGAHVLTVHTVIPRSDFALELHSTFVGHPGVSTHVVHLTLGPPGCEPAISSADHDGDDLDPTYAPRACVYEHAQHLIEVLAGLGHRAAVDVPGERAFAGLERVARPA